MQIWSAASLIDQAQSRADLVNGVDYKTALAGVKIAEVCEHYDQNTVQEKKIIHRPRILYTWNVLLEITVRTCEYER